MRSSDSAERSTGARTPAYGSVAQVPLEELPPGVRDQVRAVLERPTMHTRGPVESFSCQPQLYHWFLDHPDRAAAVWRRLGAKVVELSDRGNGRFGWSDTHGSDIHWDTVYRSSRLRIWHAEGRVRPGAMLPLIPVQAVLVLRYAETRDLDGRSVLRHQAELVIHTDSKSAALAARVLGASAPHVAEQYVAQLEMFFSALPWYLNQHPEKTATLLAGIVPMAEGK
jgi:hypothetical protein